MRIALLNLPVDNNYGGNLQRYALMKVLQDMGHEVIHLNIRLSYQLPLYKKPFSYMKRLLFKYVLRKNIKIRQELYFRQKYEKECRMIEPFYQKYINHTKRIINPKQLRKYKYFDAYVVGSDQVWRKIMARKYLQSMFFDFLPIELKVKRIAYGISLGVTNNELNQNEIKQLSQLYLNFDAVSVREDSSLELFREYGWISPQAIRVLDPTMLLHKEDYFRLIEDSSTYQSDGNLFCYILDKTEKKNELIHKTAEELHLKPFYLGLKDDRPVSIEQWLRSFIDAEYVITDSFHGLAFSIIFGKPYFLIRNEIRGNARFDSILRMLNLSDRAAKEDIVNAHVILEQERYASINFLTKSLK